MAVMKTSAAQAPVFAQFVNVASQIAHSVVSWNSKRKTRKALNRLTDRELLDIGLVRGDIHSIT